MGSIKSEKTRRAEFGGKAEAAHQRLSEWRRRNPAATFDEIAEQLGVERKRLMGELLGEVATQAEVIPGVSECPECGEGVQNKGKKKRQVLHREGEVQLERDYYYCPACRQGFFPSGPESGTESPWLESGYDCPSAASGS